MVAGLAFLSKKGFNPQNLKNQKTVWEARQQKENEAKRLKEREEQLKRERDDEELARARGGERGGDRAQLKFMYDAPPGAAGTNVQQEEEDDGKPAAQESASNNFVTERQPGDDDAAAAFRRMLAAAASNTEVTNDSTTPTAQDSSTNMPVFSDDKGAALSGTNVERPNPTNTQLSALEKAVGRRDANSGLTLEEQIARFPQLKNAPMAKGMTATNVNVTFRPLGTQLRNTRCFVCGVWGHSKGDRECSMSGWDPFSSSNKPSVAVAATGMALKQQDGRDSSERSEGEDEKRAARREDSYSSGSSSDSEDSRRRRRKHHRKKHKSRRHESKRKRRSYSPDDDERRRRKSSHKRRKKHSKHDDD